MCALNWGAFGPLGGFLGGGLWRSVTPACGLPRPARLRRLPGLQLPRRRSPTERRRPPPEKALGWSSL